MVIGEAFLGLLKTKQRHGYELKRVYDDQLGQGKPLAFGQVYSVLSRLTKNGLIEATGVAPGEGPERKLYALTPAGTDAVEKWFASPEKPDMYLQSTLYAKVVLALLAGVPAADILDTQQHEHLRLMREVTRRKATGDLTDHLVCDYALFHLEADLRWLELTAARLDDLAKEVLR